MSNFLWPAWSAIAAIGAPSVAALVMNPLRSEWLANSAGSSPTAAQRRLIMRETLDAWLSAARIAEGPLFRTVRAGKVSKAGISLRT